MNGKGSNCLPTSPLFKGMSSFAWLYVNHEYSNRTGKASLPFKMCMSNRQQLRLWWRKNMRNPESNKDLTEPKHFLSHHEKAKVLSCSQVFMGWKYKEKNADSWLREETVLSCNMNFKVMEEFVICNWITLKEAIPNQRRLKSFTWQNSFLLVFFKDVC